MEKYSENIGLKIAITLALCFLIAICEGFDLQSMGVAAPRMREEFGLNPTQMGWIFSAAIIGTLPGAIIGGRMADKIGRKKVLISSVLIFGLMSFLTPFISEFSLLIIVRFLTGLGMGGALPMMITIASEIVEEKYKTTAVNIMYSGIPCGGIIASVISMLLNDPHEWRHIFYVGGIVPILLVPLLMLFLSEFKVFKTINASITPLKTVLFAQERRISTILIWTSSFCTLIVLYFLINWMPLLMGAQGLTKIEASYVQIAYNLGGMCGSVLIGFMISKMKISIIVKLIYAGILASLCCLAISHSLSSLVISAIGCGIFIIGGQATLYGLAAIFYPSEMRGSGVGATVAVGRIGSFVGPLVAGMLLSLGSTPVMVISYTIPVILIAALSVLILVSKPAAVHA